MWVLMSVTGSFGKIDPKGRKQKKNRVMLRKKQENPLSLENTLLSTKK